MWLDAYLRDEKIRKQFADCANQLITRGFICEMKWNAKLGMNDRNAQFQFIYLHQELFGEYFKMIGWELAVDEANHVIHLFNPSDTGRVRLTDLQTRTVFCLYLLFEENRQQLGGGEYTLVYARDVARKLKEAAGVPKPPVTRLAEAFAMLSKYGLIEKVDGDWADPDSKIQIMPSIARMITADTVHTLRRQFVDHEGQSDT